MSLSLTLYSCRRRRRHRRDQLTNLDIPRPCRSKLCYPGTGHSWIFDRQRV